MWHSQLSSDWVTNWESGWWLALECVYCLLFTILRPFGTRESIRQKVDHGGQIVLWYWQHATNLARATMFVICMNSARVLMWVRGRVEQKRSLTFCVFEQIRNKCSSSSTFPKSQPRQSLSLYGTNTQVCDEQNVMFKNWIYSIFKLQSGIQHAPFRVPIVQCRSEYWPDICKWAGYQHE
jgi:hypothetical protein